MKWLVSHGNCFSRSYGQLRNEDLHLNLYSRDYRKYSCDYVDKTREHKIRCFGKTVVQDFAPRMFSSSFGFKCEKGHDNQTLSGLTYKISIYDLTNETQCMEIPVHASENMCLGFESVQLTSYPSLTGAQDIESARNTLNDIRYIKALMSEGSSTAKVLDCHQHSDEFICHILFPKCDKSLRQVIPVCKEFCLEVTEACWSTLAKISSKTIAKLGGEPLARKFQEPTRADLMDCGYLPSLYGKIPCFYKSVECKAPPAVPNARPVHHNQSTDAFSVNSTATYYCASEGYRMEGNSTVTCLHSGEWSEPPHCKPLTQSPVLIVLPVFGLMSSIFISIWARLCWKRKYWTPQKGQLRICKEYDAFVCYNFDRDHDFVSSVLVPELEEKHEPPFKLLLESRDFTPGLHIEENIQNAIGKSNCAVVLMSQGFVHSKWCQLEFEYSSMESDRNDNFELFMIMMQNQETLVDVPACINHYLMKRTYLKKEDPQFLKKIADSLNSIRVVDSKDDEDGVELVLNTN